MTPSLWIGFDPREAAAYAVARYSLERSIPENWLVFGLRLSELQRSGLYRRPTRIKTNGDGRFEMIDELSIRSDYDGRMSTEHAIARFLVPILAESGWAMFMDGDVLVRKNLAQMFYELDPKYAVYCVKHNHHPSETTKMDNQEQTRYDRKNWSSVVIWNCDHPSNKALTVELVNTAPGRDLHAFCWLQDSEIGELKPEFNWLVGYSDPSIDPVIAHFTAGLPNMAGYENVRFADEWRTELACWAA